MLESLQISNKKVSRVYILLDKPFDMSIMEHEWSTTKCGWIMEKMIWNTWEETIVRNSLRDGKYMLGII